MTRGVSPRRHRTGEEGLGLIEIMVAITILAVALLGLGQLMVLAAQQNGYSRYNTIAIQIARGKVEELRSLYNYGLSTHTDVAALTDGLHGPVTVTVNSGMTGYANRQFNLQWTVTTPATSVKRVVIQVKPTYLTNGTSTPLRSKTISVNSTFAP